jgi:hypothetical protein
MAAPQSRLVFICSKCGCKKSYPFRLFPSQIKCDECGGLMNPETQAEKPLGAGNFQSGPSKSPPPLPAKNGDLPLLPSAMMFQKVLEKNNFAVVAGVMLVGFGVCMVGIMVFVGGVFLKDKKLQGNQVVEGPRGNQAEEKNVIDKIRLESERIALAKAEKTKNDEIERMAMVETEKLAESNRKVMVEKEKTEKAESNRKEMEEKAKEAQGKNPKNYGYDRFDPIVELVDNHAFSATKEQEKDIETLASYLGVFGKKYSPANEYLQVRAIYSWITNNIKYDHAALVDGVTRDNDAVQVFKSKKAVCHGQAVLFKAFCDELKIKCHVVNGPVKTRFIEDGKLVEHAWNAVEIHGKWHLLDCTWGCMVDNEKNEVRLDLYTLNEFYFLTDPELLILNHFTKDPDWQLLKTPKTLEQFVKEPNYSANNYLLMTGVPLSVISDFVRKNSIDDLVLTWPVFCPIQVLAMPLQGKLEINKKYKFAFKVPANFRIDIKMGESISQPMIKDKEGNYVAEIKIDKVAPVHIVLWNKENKIDGGDVFAIYNYVKKD